jgi:hypothetical protein
MEPVPGDCNHRDRAKGRGQRAKGREKERRKEERNKE